MKTFEDIKKSVSIKPLQPGGSNFKSHKLKQISLSKLKYIPTIGGVIFCLLFLVIGLVVLGIGLKPLINSVNIKNVNWFLIVFGTVFSIVGGSFLYIMCKPRVFSKQENSFYKSYLVSNSKDKIRLNSIIAIQIIGETINSDNGSYGSFELNLVLNDGTRQNVVDHGNIKSIINDAYVISKFLNVPIWHAESNKTKLLTK